MPQWRTTSSSSCLIPFRWHAGNAWEWNMVCAAPGRNWTCTTNPVRVPAAWFHTGHHNALPCGSYASPRCSSECSTRVCATRHVRQSRRIPGRTRRAGSSVLRVRFEHVWVCLSVFAACCATFYRTSWATRCCLWAKAAPLSTLLCKLISRRCCFSALGALIGPRINQTCVSTTRGN